MTQASAVRGTTEYVAARQDTARQLSTIAQTELPVPGAQGDLFGQINEDDNVEVCGLCHEVTENCWCPPF